MASQRKKKRGTKKQGKMKTLGAVDRKKLATKVDPKPTGRPKLEMDWELIETSMRANSTMEEVAQYLRCSIDTLRRRIKEEHGCTYQEYYERHCSEGVMSVRRAHFKSALDGDVRAQISILKNHADYSDTLKVDLTEPTRIFYPDNGRDPNYVKMSEESGAPADPP